MLATYGIYFTYMLATYSIIYILLSARAQLLAVGIYCVDLIISNGFADQQQ
jgi:hypothetical protein